jgi:hypothetical protein
VSRNPFFGFIFIPNELKSFGTKPARLLWFMECVHIEDMDISLPNKVIEPELSTIQSFFCCSNLLYMKKNQGLYC